MTRLSGAMSVLVCLLAALPASAATTTGGLADAPQRGGESEASQRAEPGAEPTTARTPASGDGESFTWEELEALIPDLADNPWENDAAAEESQALEQGLWRSQICIQVAEIGSRIKRRRCYTLEKYLAANCRWSRDKVSEAAWCRDKERMIEHLTKVGFRQ